MAKQFRAGAASVDLSPKQPELLFIGGLNRTASVVGNLPGSPMCADALAFEVGGTTIIIATNDAGGIGREEEMMYREAVAKRIGCKPEHVLVGGRHNHSSGGRPVDDNDTESVAASKEYRDGFFEGTVQACVQAYENLKPAEIVSGQAKVSPDQPIGQNRRMQFSHGGVTPMWNSGAIAVPGEKFVGPAGPDATEIDFMFVREVGQEKPFAVLTSYPSHIHLSAIPYFSAEAVGGIKNAIHQVIPDLVVVYAAGTGGDVDMHCTHPIPIDSVEDEVKWFEESAAILGKRFADSLFAAMPDGGYTQPADIKHLRYSTEGLDPRLTRLYEINGFALGDTAILGIPHELFIEFGLDMHEANPYKNLINVAFSGSGWLGYMGTLLNYEEGGYEMGRDRGPSPEEEQALIDAGVEDRRIGRARMETGREITNKAIEVLQQLAKM